MGCPGKSVKEQELSDLTASILATFPRMSNMFLHFRQVIDSRLQKEGPMRTKLWKLRTIRSIKLLNKWMICAGSFWLRLTGKSCPFCFLNPLKRDCIF